MITREYLETDDWVLVGGRFAVVVDWWDASGMRPSLTDPTRLCVVYNNGERCAIPNDDRVVPETME